jgi:hypothetical protein
VTGGSNVPPVVGATAERSTIIDNETDKEQ